MRRGTFYGVHKKQLINIANKIWTDGITVKPKKLPSIPNSVSDEDLIDILIKHGLSSTNAEIMTKSIWKLRRLSKWYQNYGKNVGEHEIRTFLILPLLLCCATYLKFESRN